MSKRKRRIKGTRRVAASPKRRSWLPLVALAAALLLVGGGVLLWQRIVRSAVPPQVTGAPRVSVSQEVVDYGDVRLNTPIETVFYVYNVGDRPLKILGEPQVEVVQGC